MPALQFFAESGPSGDRMAVSADLRRLQEKVVGESIDIPPVAYFGTTVNLVDFPTQEFRVGICTPI